MILQSPLKSTSLEFFRSLKFQITEFEGERYASDKGIIIRLNPDPDSSPGVMLFRENARDIIPALSEELKVVPTKEGFEFTDPSGTIVTLVESSSLGKSPEVSSGSLAGNLAGITIGLADPPLSIMIWKILGFSIVAGSEDQGWAALADSGGSAISILNMDMCPHKFFNPSLSYFNGDNNMKIIEGIREAGIDIEEEITAFNDKGIVDNIIIREPGGIGFFIFSD